MIEFNCASCGKSLQVDDQYAGKQARCPGCNQVVRVPEVSVAEPAAPAPAPAPAPGGAQGYGMPYARQPMPKRKAEKKREDEPAAVGGEDYMPSPDDAPDEECRYFAILKTVCGIGGIIAALFCIVVGGIMSGIEEIGFGAILLGLVAAFFCVVFGGAGWVIFSYLAKIAVYLYSIDKRLKR